MRVPTEEVEARSLVQWLGNRPWGKRVHHNKNEVVSGQRRHGAFARAAGVRKGYPDYSLLHARWGWHSCHVELKRQGYTQSAVKPEQQEWLDHLFAEGNLALVAGGWLEAAAIFEWYENGPAYPEAPRQWPTSIDPVLVRVVDTIEV